MTRRLAGRHNRSQDRRAANGQREESEEMELSIKGLRVLVTAGAGGIGREVARAFVAEGGKVHVCDVDAGALQKLSTSDPAISRSQADVADRAQVARLFDEALARLNGLDVLVNNAGVAGPTGRIEEIAPEDWDHCLAVNITGQFNCARLAIPHLRKSKNASIVNLSSAAGRLGFPLRTPYSASKWAVVGLTKSLAAELGTEGIRVNAIQPGVVEGERIERVFEAKAKARGTTPDVIRAELLAKVSMKTTVTPQQIADAIVFICSPRGRTISGQAISICGDTQMLS
jgi:NAD(P)-dependent dehydrogenase (short-subunit alcohol dehydrogenase family)